jgi:integrase
MDVSLTANCTGERFINMKLTDIIDRKICIVRIVSEGYKKSLHSAVRSLAEFLGREPVIADLNDDVLNDLAAWVVTRGRSRPTANRIVRTLCVIARFARRKGLTTYRPDVEKLPEEKPVKASYRADEFARLLVASRRLYGRTYWGCLLEATLLVCYDTGLRIIDVVTMPDGDCDLDRGIVRVHEKKTGNFRPFVIHQQTIDAIRMAWSKMPPNHPKPPRLLPYPFKESQPLRKKLRCALVSAGMPSGRKTLFQAVRRTTATLGKSAGLDPQEILGHTSKWVTDRYYVDDTQTAPMDVANQIPRPRIA